MKPKNYRSLRLRLQAPQFLVALAGLALSMSNTAQAVGGANLIKADTTTLSLSTDWAPAQVPTINDLLNWSGTPISAANNVALSLGGDVSCIGVDFRDPIDHGTLRSLKIASGNTLTLGTGYVTFTVPRAINQSNNKGMATVLDCAVNLTAASNFDMQGSMVFNNTISQSGGNWGVSKIISAGAMHLNAANSYTGTTVTNGILTLGASGTLGVTTGNLQVGIDDANIAILDLGGTTQTAATINIARGYVLNGTLVANSYSSAIGLVSANLTGASAPLSANDTRGLTLSGTNTYGGGTSIGGILRATKPAALPNSGASGAITITNSSAFLSVRAGAPSGEWTSGDINSLLANPTFTVTAGGGALGINTTSGDFSYGSVIPAKTNMGLRKLGPNTLTLSGANLYPSTTTITRGTLKLDAGAGGSLASTSAITFTGTGALNFDNTTAVGTTSQTLGALTASAGGATVQLTRTAAQTTDLKFASLAPRTAGATLNLTVAGTPGVNGTDSKIWFTTAPSVSAFLDQGTFFGGSNYAAYDVGGYLRAMNYASDTNGASVASSSTTFTAAGVNGKHVDLGTAGSISAGITESINSLRIGGTNGVTLAAGSTLTLTNGGLLKTGGNASTISGGTGLTSTATDLVIRTDAASDALTINSPILLNTVTKSGAGTLELAGTNTFTQLTLNAGKLNLKGPTAFPSSGFTLLINEGTTLDNTSGGTMTVGNGAANVKINGSFTFVGTNDLTIANGNGTFSSMPNDIIITVAANTLRMEKELAGANYSSASLTKNGAGTFFFGGNGTMRFGGGLIINQGVVTGSNQQPQNVAGVGPVTLGDTSGSNPATLWVQNGADHSNPLTARAGSTGIIALVDSNNSRWTGPVTLNNALTLSEINNSSNALYIYGVISGASDLNIGNPGAVANIVVSGVTSSLANVGTVRLFRTNTYSGNTWVNSGTLKLDALASVNNTPLISLAAGTTLDVSAIAAYTLSSTTTLGAKGTGTTAGTTQATIKGGTTVNLGAQPINLTYTPTSVSGDATHPSLVVSQGSLTLSNNALSVVNNGPALAAGVYTLIKTPGAITGVPNTAAVAVTGNGLVPNSQAFASVSGNNVILTVSTKQSASFSGLPLSQTIQFGTSNVTLSGSVSAAGPVYPADGEAVHVTINGVTNHTTTTGGTGSFTVVFPTATLPGSAGAGISYPITYTYDATSTWTAATDSSTSLTVTTQVVPTITSWPTTTGLTYGDALTSATLTGGSASVPGTFTYTFPSTVPGAVGTYAASATFTPTNTASYSTVVVPSVISVPVSQKNLTITSPAIPTRGYDGTLNGTLAGTLSGVLAGDVGLVSLVGIGIFESANSGSGILVDVSSSTLSGAKASNYSLDIPFGLVGTITATPLTVKADNLGRPVGVANPPLTYTVSGYAPSENATSVGLTGTPVLSTTATIGSPDGSYPITCAAGDVAITDSNYTLAFVPGNLQVLGVVTWAKGNGAWDINTSINWKSLTSSPVTYVDGGAVQFADVSNLGSGPFTVALNTTVHPYTVEFTNAAYDYIISGTGSIAGTTSVTKMGLGALTLETSNTYSGGTHIAGGKLTIGNQHGLGTGPVTLDAGTTLQQAAFEGNGAAGAIPNTFVLNGSGNVIVNAPFTDGKDIWLNQIVSGTGGLTVQGGGRKLTLTANNTFSGGVRLTADGNHLNISHANALGAGTVRVEGPLGVSDLVALTNLNTGVGVPNAFDIASGAYLNISTQGDGGTVSLLLSGPITSAVGTGGVNKVGAGTLTLSGTSTYSGNTVVAGGTLALDVNGGLKFVVTNTAANKITGAGIATLDGKFTIDTTAVTTSSGTWTLVDASTKSFGSTFTVIGFTPNVDGVTWTMSASGKNWTFVETTGVLTLTSGSDYNTWISGYTFAPGADTSATGDPDGDGMTNQQEYAFGLNPTLGSSANPITVLLNKTTGMFSYIRRATPATTGLTYAVLTSTDLTTWTPDATAVQTVTGTVGAVETVQVTLSGTKPLSNPKLFVRVAAVPAP